MGIDFRYGTNNDNLYREFSIGDEFVEGLQHIVVTYDLLHLVDLPPINVPPLELEFYPF